MRREVAIADVSASLHRFVELVMGVSSSIPFPLVTSFLDYSWVRLNCLRTSSGASTL